MSLLGVRQTWPIAPQMSAFEPKADIGRLFSAPIPNQLLPACITPLQCVVRYGARRRTQSTRSWRGLINSHDMPVQNGQRQIRRGPPMQQIADWLEKLGLGQTARCSAFKVIRLGDTVVPHFCLVTGSVAARVTKTWSLLA